jgi:23S rRNA (uracil1939-C5)-methyltransferase
MPATPIAHEIVDLDIERIGVRGDGVAHHRGEPIYVPFTVPGDRVRAALGPRRGDGRAAALVEVTVAAPRAAAACPHFGSCGGCSLQHLPDQLYAASKLALLHGALNQHGIAEAPVAPLTRLAPGTRRRARLAMGRPRNPKAPPVVGFNGRASHSIVDMRACAILDPALAAIVAPLRRLAATLLQPGEGGAATIAKTDHGLDLLLDLPRTPALAGLEAMAALAETHDLARLAWRGPGLDEPVPAALRRPATVTFAGVPVDLPYDAFLQASVAADQALSAAVVALVGSPARLIDLFSGLGTFTFALAQLGAVLAVEQSAPAITALGAAARRAGLGDRVRALRRDLEHEPLRGEELAGIDALVFDPPRAGALAQSAEIARSKIPLVVAVSCNPATFARDAATLIAGGYRLDEIRPFDSFVWSPHLELVARFRRA